MLQIGCLKLGAADCVATLVLGMVQMAQTKRVINIRVIRFELMISTWKVEVIPLNYTRLFIKNKALSALTRHKLPPLPPMVQR